MFHQPHQFRIYGIRLVLEFLHWNDLKCFLFPENSTQSSSCPLVECEKGEKKLDAKLKKLFWIGEEATPPRTEQDMEKFCL